LELCYRASAPTDHTAAAAVSTAASTTTLSSHMKVDWS